MISKHTLSALLIAVWSAAIFELGFSFFIDNIGCTIFMIAAICLVIIVLYHLLIGKRTGELVSGTGLAQNIQWFIGAYAAYYALTVIWTPAILDGAKAAATLVWYIMVYTTSLIALGWIPHTDRSRLFAYSGWIALIVLITVTSYRFIAFTEDFIQSKYRFSVFRDYNVYTQSMMIAISAMFIKIYGKETQIRHLLLYYLLGILSVLLGIASGSRRALLLYGPVFLISPLLLAFLRGKKSMRRSVIFLMVLGVVISCSLPSLEIIEGNYNISNISPRVERALGFITGDYEDDNRIERWNIASSIYCDLSYLGYFFGIGARGYLYDSRFIRPDGNRDTPHNFFLAALLEGGLLQIFFLAIALIIIALIFYNVVKNADFWVSNFLIANGMIWILSISISGEGFFDNKLVFLILLVMTAYSRNNLIHLKPYK